MSLELRINAILESDVQKSPWESLISLFQADREAFYTLACDGVSQRADEPVRKLAELAADVRIAVRESYEIEASENGANLISYSGKTNFIPDQLVKQVAEFLREIDGKTTATIPGKDYEGTPISEAEARFRLGGESTWESNHAKLEARRNARPFVLRLDNDDLLQLSSEPPYVTYELLNCARKTVLAPTSVYKGLKRGEGSLPKVNNGWAFCGKPRLAYRNDGTSFPAPDGMVFVVYADEDGYVFDWDWVKENPGESGCPLDPRLRFENPHPLESEANIELPKELSPGKFDATQASYSRRGDCIFCFITDDVSYADRINADLTVFYDLNSQHISGFKVKNLQRILEQDKSIVLDDAPDLMVSVQGALLATLKGHADTHVNIYEVIIEAIHRRGGPPKVKVPKLGADLIEA